MEGCIFMVTLLNNYEAIFGLCAIIFSAGGLYDFVRALPKIIKKSINEMDGKIEKLDNRMDSSDKTIQNMQIAQARNDEKINNVQQSQSEMRSSISEMTKMLNIYISKNRGRGT